MIQILLAILLLMIPSTVLAELPTQLEKDFAPLDGYVVMPMGANDYLIDLDASKGVRTGDIFSIIRPGEKITHPISGEIIGNLDGSKTFLLVTRLKSGYSYVQKIGGDGEVNKGDRIKRFDAIPARFSDTSNVDPGLKAELQSKLNRLDWLSDQSSTNPLLIFERNPNSLQVKNYDGTSLFSYPLAQLGTILPTNTTVLSGPVTVPVATASAAATSSEQGIIQNRIESTKIWYGADHKDEILGLRIDDFNNDGIIETALLLQKKLVISSYEGKQRKAISELPFSGGLTLLAIDSLDLNGNGKPEIFLSALKNGVPASQVYELEGNKLNKVATEIPFLFRRIEHPQQGPLVLGQKRRDLHTPFSGKPFTVTYTNGTYTEGATYPLPDKSIIYGMTPFVAENGTVGYAYLSSSDYIKIKSADGEELFESPDRYGGSEIIFKLQAEASRDQPISYFLPQRLLVVNGEILVLQNEGQRYTQNWHRFDKSRLISLKWNGLSLDESWRTSDQSGQAADFEFADIDNDGQAELVLAVKFSHKDIFSSAKSAIVVYEMQ